MLETFQKVVIARVIGPQGVVKNPSVDTRLFPETPIFFAAGPLQGAPDWHPELYNLLAQCLPRFLLVIPTRYTSDHVLVQHQLLGMPDHFPRQRHFEAFYIKYAREAMRSHPAGGALLFNLCCQETPRADGRPYGTDSWREASETYTRLEYEPGLSVLVSADEAFPGRELLKDCYDEAVQDDFPFFSSLEELAEAARACVS